eukprot:TRINITY_DN975_c0_g1_i1.p1 TRINITY_DN975_c0_g1~~TRINITY_DN975_c0_g1_i1.p1  ORF type:complete len:944 (+),score=418.69 TRINITY_DN975_c0_g1_i1:187-3018(+)
MNYVESFFDGMHNALNLNAATLSGSIDIVVIPQEDGTWKSTPFHVRFGKFHLLNSSDKTITLFVNEKEIELKMRLGRAGEAYFVESTEEPVSASEVVSPIVSGSSTPKHPIEPKKKSKEPEITFDSSQMETLTSKLEQVMNEKKGDVKKENDGGIPIGKEELHSHIMQNVHGDSPVGSPPSNLDPNAPKKGYTYLWNWGALPSVKKNDHPEDSQKEEANLKEKDKEIPLKQPQSPTKENKGGEAKSWTGKMGNLFQIFKPNPNLEPNYLVKSDSNYESGNEDLDVDKKSARNELFFGEMDDVKDMNKDEEDESDMSSAISSEGDEEDENYQSASDEEGGNTNATEGSLAHPSEKEEKKIQEKGEKIQEKSEDRAEKVEEKMTKSSEEDASLYERSLLGLGDEVVQKKVITTETHIDNVTGEKETKVKVEKPSEEKKEEGLSQLHDNSHGGEEIYELDEGNDNHNELSKLRDEVHSANASPSSSLPNSLANSTSIPVEEKKEEKKQPPLVINTEDMNSLKISFSKCFHLLFPENAPKPKEEEAEKLFQQYLISHEEYSKNPEVVVSDVNVVVKVNNRMYPWTVAGPIIISALAYRKNLDQSVVEKLEKTFQEKSKRKSGWGSWLWNRSSSSNLKADLNAGTPQKPLTSSTQIKVTADGKETTIVEKKEVFIKKSLRPTTEQLKEMGLQPGPNNIRFRVSSSLQGVREVRSMIYLWDRNDKIVISDIDGTITKSDALGQILPIMGRDWSHSGVVQLYSNIKANNYHILYLTSRAIGQAGITKGYINTLKQGDVLMPLGPVFLSPNRLLTAFNNEVILRRPEEFKIACLKDIKSLFPENSQPFYAGFGNRTTDALSYRTVGIPLGKIFTINYKGELSIVNHTYRKTFGTLNELINEMFPAIQSKNQSVDEEWNEWNYWKEPMKEVELVLEEKPAPPVDLQYMGGYI